jgi:hypothetical protein
VLGIGNERLLVADWTSLRSIACTGPREPMRLYANLNHMHLIDPATDLVL